MKRILLTLALLLAPAIASAQCNGVFPNGTICGNITGAPNLPRPVSNSALTGVPGGTNGQIQYNNSNTFGGFGPITGDVTISVPSAVSLIQPNAITTSKIAAAAVTNAKLAAGAANTVKGSLDGSTTSDLTIASCSAIYQFTQWLSGTGWQCGINPVLPSRITAAGLNLSAFTGVSTLGYANPGDGGGATFKLISSSNNFLDSQVSGLSTTAGTVCSNNTYTALAPTGGSGSLLIGTAVVSSGGLTSFTITGTGGNAYKVGDVLTIPHAQIACTIQPTLTVTSITSPNGSFTDSASNKFQIMARQMGPINVRQFGAVGNYIEATGDAGATNDQGPIQAALRYSAAGNGTIDAGGTSGATVLVPAGGWLVCNGLQIPTGVIFTGLSQTGTLLKECDADGLSNHFITLGDPASHVTAFFPSIQNMTLFGSGNGTTATGFAMVYSRSAQGADTVKNLAIYSTNRECVKYEIGDGGTAMFGVWNTYCVPNGVLSPSPAMEFSGGSGFLIGGGTFFSVGGTLWSGTAINIGNGANTEIDGVHCENLTTCINYDGTGSSPGLVEIRQGVGNAALTNFVIIQTGSVAGNVVISTFNKNGASCSVIKAGSCVSTVNIITPTAF